MTIQFFFLQHNISLTKRTALKQFIHIIFKKEKKSLDNLTYIFCSDDYLLEINKSHLQHNYYTDIITFDLSDTNSGKITGEVYISIDRVRDNANTLGVSIKEELHRVIFHGALHLCGYKDKSIRHAKEMRLAEEKFINLYFSECST
ncbi:rRNA maturation RNase YbeY [Ferruginibacter sp.]|nr:rRNA maturation RNase YbeY [Ferruginibacter sp.]